MSLLRTPRWLHRKQRRARASIAKRVGIAVTVVIVILLVDLGSTVWGVVQLGDVNQQLQQKDVPLSDDSEALLVALVNEETGVRGYLLTQNQAFTAPLNEGRDSYARLVSQLQGLTAGDSSLAADLANVESRVSIWETQFEAPALATAGTATPVQIATAAPFGKRLFDDIRAAQARMEKAIVAATNRDFAEASAVRSRIVIGVASRAVIGVGSGALLLLLALRAILRPVRDLRDLARAMKEDRMIGATQPPAPPELMEVHEAIVAAGLALKEREAALAQANVELEQASRLKSEFLATMSHELRTPLNAILGFTDLVRSGATGEIAPQADDYLERVRRNGAILLELINDVLDLSKIEAGRMAVNADVIDLEPAVREIVTNVQSLADAKGISLELHAADGETLALADSRALKQVVTNLISNAVKFTVNGSVSVRLRVRGGAALIDVEDSGPGIAADDQEAIFEPFRQVGAHARTGTGGTGLGLAISVRLARLMGGDITLNSEPGKGSRFTLRLPSVQGYANSGQRTDEPLILGVDDDLDALNLLQAQCERMGFNFVGVRQLSAAVAAAVTLRPAVILLDIIFPDGSGWHVLEQLQADPGTANIPVYVISVTDGEDQAKAATVRFLQKPVSEETLREELRQYQSVAVGAAV
jgi:signal transduction histidine kinase/CheY-like chemotaxis protein